MASSPSTEVAGAAASPRPRAFRPAARPRTEVSLVVFDLAGTLVDHGSRAPLEALIEAFGALGVEVIEDEVRKPMGLDKRAHIRALLSMPEVQRRFERSCGRQPEEGDVDTLYEAFVPCLLATIDERAVPITGAVETVAELRRRGLRIATTTGYFRRAADRVHEVARGHGLSTDCDRCTDDVATGRPAPWMVFECMRALDVYPPSAVVKVGDTAFDVEEGRNAGAWAVGVARSSSAVGLTEAQWSSLPPAEAEARLERARQQLLRAGAHRVIDTVTDLPALLDDL